MSDLVSKDLNMIFKTPKGETVHALKNVNFTLKKGELLTVLGPSGCGKTTLLNIAAGFLRPTSGSIVLAGNEINGPGVERGMVFQQGALFEWLTVSENVDFGLRIREFGDLGIGDLGIWGFWDFGFLDLGFGILGFGDVEIWDLGIWDCGFGILDFGILGFWDFFWEWLLRFRAGRPP